MIRTIAQIVSWLTLVWVTVPSVLFWAGKIDQAAMITQMNIATVMWFIATPLWMGRKPQATAA